MAIVEVNAHGIVINRFDVLDIDLFLTNQSPWERPTAASAAGENTRRYSLGNSKCVPSLNAISSRRECWFSRISLGVGFSMG